MAAFNRSELADLNVFMTIIRRRSFRHAAHELGVTTSALSHTMRNLETRLGVKLLYRTSRAVEPTDAGTLLAEKLRQGFAMIQDGLDTLDLHRESPIGRLRLNVPRDAAALLLAPILGEFTNAYPQLRLDVIVEDAMIDIVAEGYDAGIRYGATVPQDMVAVPLTGTLRWIMVASPGYLARCGIPQAPKTCCSIRASACTWAIKPPTNGNWATARGSNVSTCPGISALPTPRPSSTPRCKAWGLLIAYPTVCNRNWRTAVW